MSGSFGARCRRSRRARCLAVGLGGTMWRSVSMRTWVLKRRGAYSAVSVQSFDAIEDDIQCPRQNTRTTRLTTSLDAICLARVRNTIRKQQTVLSLQDVFDQRQRCLCEELGLGGRGREDVRESVHRRRWHRREARCRKAGRRLGEIQHADCGGRYHVKVRDRLRPLVVFAHLWTDAKERLQKVKWGKISPRSIFEMSHTLTGSRSASSGIIE